MNYNKELEDLQAYGELYDIADSVVDLEARVAREERQGLIDWLLEKYITSETGIYARLERLQPDNLYDVGSVSSTIYGLMKYYDEETIKDMANEHITE